MRFAFYTLVLLLLAGAASAQCTLTNATSCVCKDGSTNCYLLPNIKVSEMLLLDPQARVEKPGELRISVSTPNVGHGPLAVFATNRYLCGVDTIQVDGYFSCPNAEIPRQIVNQRVYQKVGNQMTYYDRVAGTMTFHPNHGHAHFDDWGVYTLRIKDDNDPNPLNWQIVGEGAKLGFCIEDYGSCSTYNGHCVDDSDNTITNNLPNYGLGGGDYNCNPTNQGITVGWTDIYYQNLEGMFITLPPNTCNGDYYIVVQVDPHNLLIEENEDDNLMVVPVTLTQQSLTPTSVPHLVVQNGVNLLCDGSIITIETPYSGTSYTWSTGGTTKQISINTPGSYYCTIHTPCGDINSDTVHITSANSSLPTVETPSAVCEGQPITLTGSSPDGYLTWYDNSNLSNPLHQGNTYQIPALLGSTTYYVTNSSGVEAPTQHIGPLDNDFGFGAYNNPNFNGWLEFESHNFVTIQSVKVYAGSAGERIIQLRDQGGTPVQSRTINIPQGEHRITLNFTTEPNKKYQLGCAQSPNMYRNQAILGVDYPFTLANLLSITAGNTSQGSTNTYYYYFYDWEIHGPDQVCTSAPVPVHIDVLTAPDATFYYNTDTLCTTEGNIIPSVTTLGGTFSASDNLPINPLTGEIQPNTAQADHPYNIYYTVQSDQCTATDTLTLLFQICGGIHDAALYNSIAIHPNPSNGSFVIQYQTSQYNALIFKLLDVLGNTVYQQKLTSNYGLQYTAIQTQHLPKGIYTALIESPTDRFYRKITIQ